LNAEIKIEKILETESISEYNKWVKKNKERYPGLMPMYEIKWIKRGEEANPSIAEEREKLMKAEKGMEPVPQNPFVSQIKVSYYDKDGKFSKEEIYTGYLDVMGWRGANFSYLIIRKKDHPLLTSEKLIIVKDFTGKTLFTLPNLPYTIRPISENIFIERYFQEGDLDQSEEYMEFRVFNRNGREIGKLKNIPGAWEGDFLPNHKYFLIYNSYEIIFFSNDLKEIWRKKQMGTRAWCNNYIAIGYEGKIYLYDLSGELVYRYELIKSFEWPQMVFSEDGKYLFAEVGNYIFLLDVENRIELWRKKAFVGTHFLRFLGKNKYILCCYISRIDIIDSKSGEVIYTEKIPIKRKKNGSIIGPIYFEFRGNFLIITQGVPTVKIIVYKIEAL
jgi:hypothetical protein